MHKRLMIVAMIAFLIAGITSATLCEMVCIPVSNTAACCAHKMQHKSDTSSITNAHQCGYPQKETALAITVVQSLQTHAAAIISVFASSPELNSISAIHDASMSFGLKRSSFIPPLRI
jgi:Flp pilus assembly protein TadD